MRTRLLIAFLIVIIAALGTVLVVSNFSANTQVRGYLRWSMNANSMVFAEELKSYYQEHGSWSGVERMFTESGGDSSMLGEGANQTGAGQTQGQGAGQTQGQGGGQTQGQGAGQTQGQGAGQTQGQTAGGALTAVRRNGILADENGKVIYANEPARIGTYLTGLERRAATPLEQEGALIGYLFVPSALLNLPANFEAQLMEKVRQAILTAALVSILAALLLALVLTNLFVKPIRELTDNAESIAAGDFSRRVNVKSYPEAESLGKTLNTMAASLQTSEQKRQALTADIAHELRNPLAVQQAQLEALEDGVFPLDLNALKPIREQNALLSRLVDDLRVLALADAGKLSLNKRPTDLRALCQTALQGFEAAFAARDLQVETHCESALPLVNADPDRILQIFHNLLMNAQRYTRQGTKIDISIRQEGAFARVDVRDHGSGIDPEDLPHIFDRFYRSDPGRERESGGTGLGLAIARNLAEAHGGSLQAENHPQGGALFSLRLPL
ncbi:MAG TPA: ATP-binding protein [Anaerolineaceae bacterium]|nr:ATP-binding protein [Anaerolineaceae bacterium]